MHHSEQADNCVGLRQGFWSEFVIPLAYRSKPSRPVLCISTTQARHYAVFFNSFSHPSMFDHEISLTLQSLGNKRFSKSFGSVSMTLHRGTTFSPRSRNSTILFFVIQQLCADCTCVSGRLSRSLASLCRVNRKLWVMKMPWLDILVYSPPRTSCRPFVR